MGSQLRSELTFFYLDDGTLGGSEEDLRHDVEVVERVGSSTDAECRKDRYYWLSRDG